MNEHLRNSIIETIENGKVDEHLEDILTAVTERQEFLESPRILVVSGFFRKLETLFSDLTIEWDPADGTPDEFGVKRKILDNFSNNKFRDFEGRIEFNDQEFNSFMFEIDNSDFDFVVDTFDDQGPA